MEITEGLILPIPIYNENMLVESGTDSDGWSDVEEMPDQPIVCLFCTNSSETRAAAWNHLKEHLDLAQISDRFKMDCYGFIKLVNFIRTHHVEPSFVSNLDHSTAPWESEEYLKPVMEDDPWLMIDFEEILSGTLPTDNSNETNKFHVVNAEGGLVTLSEQHFADLQQRIRSLTSQVLEKDSVISGLLEDMRVMRVTTQNLVSNGEDFIDTLEKCVKNVSLEDDQWYFSTYARVGIHKQMLSDRVRTSSYRDAIIKNTESIKGRTVLDLGCGTGILSMFAASAGAAQVIGVDQSDIIYQATDIVRENNLSDKIQLVKGRLEDTELPVKEVDVIVSEWMGYFLLFEGMLDSVIYGRDHHLTKGGLLLPNRCSLNIVGLSDTELHKNEVGFWSDVYGYHMNCMRKEVVIEPLDIVVSKDKIITTLSPLLMLDLYKCTTKDLDFASEFSLQAKSDNLLTALVGYFDIFFDLPAPVSFSTGPHARPTHWKQTLFFLEEPIPVKQGDTITGKLICQRTTTDVRSLTITIELVGKKMKYFM